MSLLLNMQTDCQARLAGQPFFSAQPAIPVFYQMQKDIQSAINTTLVKLGVGVIILSARLSNKSPAAGSWPKWDRVTLVARVYENVTINRAASGTGQPADLIAEAVAYYLHSWAPACTGYKLICDDVSIVDDPQCLVYDVRVFSGGISNTAPVRL